MGHPEPSWKATERRIARFLGTERTPTSGGMSRHTRSDTLHPRLFLEIKWGGVAGIGPKARAKLLERTETLAKQEGKVPVLVLHQKGKRAGLGTYPCYLYLTLGNGARRVLVSMSLADVKDLDERGLL